jgi:hypothetical protein
MLGRWGGVLKAECIPYPGQPCTADQNATLLAFRNQFVSDIAAVTTGKPKNGVYLDGCHVHAQNVRCTFWIEVYTQGVPLSFTPPLLLRLKRCHAFDQCHSSQVCTPLTG